MQDLREKRGSYVNAGVVLLALFLGACAQEERVAEAPPALPPAAPVSDRGPYVAGRIIDLSQAAARQLGLERPGIGLVGITVLRPTRLASAR